MLTLGFLAVFAFWRIDNPRVERLRMQAADALHPAWVGLGEPLTLLTEMAADVQDLARVYEQNQELRREIQRLRAWREAARELEQENARLRALNNVRLPPETGFVTGEIIADAGGPFLHTGLVNIGYRDGVQDGAAVMDGAGLAGRIVGLGRRAARVLYVTDYSSNVPVIIRPSGRRAILRGDGAASPRLDFLESAEGVRPGDRVVTSGDGSVFPADLLVGAAVQGPDGLARVRLSADLARVEFVRVLRWRPDTEIETQGD
ncbi:MAG: rod shape-determining protein MreC, partial [Pseudomonadota bacterium]